jgi:uncharacterized membrane protein YqiK
VELGSILIPLVSILAVPALFLIVVLAFCRRECEPNHLLVVYGKLRGGRTHVVLKEGSRIVWPIIQDYVYISRAPLNVTDENGTSIAVVRVGADEELMGNAAVNLLGLERDEIARLAREVILASGHPDDSPAVEEELRKLGLVLMKS